MATLGVSQNSSDNQTFEKLFQETVLRDENAVFWAAT
jgi:hypothetical protein